MTIPALLLSLLALAPHPATRPADGPVRATWVTTTANDAVASPEQTRESMRRLKAMGFNRVYVECWKNGYTEFPSPTMAGLIGVELKINGGGPQRDLLKEMVDAAHAEGLEVIAWFEYGFMAAHKDTHNELRDLARERGWLTYTQDGKEVGEQNPFVWMNPLHPEPQQLLIDLVLEAVEAYDLDGVQLDDRIAMPVEMGYDDYTKQLYASEHNGVQPPADARDAAWVQWRADKITEYAGRFADAVKQADAELIVSVSPAPFPWSRDNYACDWPEWQKRGQAWDEYVPQCYRTSFDAFEANWREQVAVHDPAAGDLIAGIRVVGAGADTPWEDVARKLELSEQLGDGYGVWFSRAALEVYPDEFRQAHQADSE